MSFEQKQILKLTKQLAIREEQHKKQRTALQQKVELLQLEVTDYHQKQIKNRHLNESILISYRQNDSFREQHSQQELTNMGYKHQEEIKKLKQKHADIKNKLDEQLSAVKEQNQKLKIDAERASLEFQKRISQVKRQYQLKLSKLQIDLNFINQHKLQLMNEKCMQTQKMNNFYKQQLQIKKLTSNQSAQCQQQVEDEEHNRQYKEYYLVNSNKQKMVTVPQLKRQVLSSLNLRINRALTQLNPNRLKLQERIKRIKNNFD